MLKEINADAVHIERISRFIDDHGVRSAVIETAKETLRAGLDSIKSNKSQALAPHIDAEDLLTLNELRAADILFEATTQLEQAKKALAEEAIKVLENHIAAIKSTFDNDIEKKHHAYAAHYAFTEAHFPVAYNTIMAPFKTGLKKSMTVCRTLLHHS